MILMWLGSFVLMMFGLTESQKYAAKNLERLQKKFFQMGFETTIGPMIIRALDVVLLEASPQRSMYSALALYNLRILDLRASNLILCLSTVGAWWVLILGLLFLSFNGFFLLGLSGLGLLAFATSKVKNILGWVFATGVFLIGAESLLRNATVIQSLLGQSEFAFFLADGRFGAVFGLLALGAILSLFIQIEFWTLALSLALLTSSTLSFNGALGLVVGERVGRMLLFWWRSRSLNQDCRRIGWQFASVSVFGVLVGFVVAGETRSLLYFEDRNLQFVFLFALVLLCQWIAQMVWGHFSSQMKVDELQEPKYISSSWLDNELVSRAAGAWAQEKVHKRLSEIRYHLQGLNSLSDGQVPEHIQVRLREEERQLALLDQSLKI